MALEGDLVGNGDEVVGAGDGWGLMQNQGGRQGVGEDGGCRYIPVYTPSFKSGSPS